MGPWASPRGLWATLGGSLGRFWWVTGPLLVGIWGAFGESLGHFWWVTFRGFLGRVWWVIGPLLVGLWASPKVVWVTCINATEFH